MHPTRDNFDISQLVRYTGGQKFYIHRDWHDIPHRLGDERRGNQPASILVYLEDTCIKGETRLPYVKLTEVLAGDLRGIWTADPDESMAFKPIEGNAFFLSL